MIKVKREPVELAGSKRDCVLEECCFCKAPTPFWTNLPDRTEGQQVACCRECARHSDPKLVPTKKEWFNAGRG